MRPDWAEAIAVRGSVGVAALAVTGMLVSGASVAVAAPKPDTVSMTCTKDVDGTPLRVRVTAVLAGEGYGDLDFARVRVRATDEVGPKAWRDPKVDVRSIRIRLYDTRGEKTLDRTRGRNPFVIDLDPLAEGGAVLDVKSTVRFRLADGKRAVARCCIFYEEYDRNPRGLRC